MIRHAIALGLVLALSILLLCLVLLPSQAAGSAEQVITVLASLASGLCLALGLVARWLHRRLRRGGAAAAAEGEASPRGGPIQGGEGD